MSESKVLTSPSLHFDGHRANRKEACVDTNGDLINLGQKGLLVVAGRGFKKYRGTCTTLPLTPTGSPQYWEIRSRVLLHSPITNITFTLFELGFGPEAEMDLHPSLKNFSRAVVIQVIHCARDNRICIRVVVDGRELDHIRTKIEMVPDKTIVFRHGLLFDDCGKIGFLDLQQNVLMTVLERVDTSRLTRPMFGVCNGRIADVKLKLISGSQIDFSSEKRRVLEQEMMR